MNLFLLRVTQFLFDFSCKYSYKYESEDDHRWRMSVFHMAYITLCTDVQVEAIDPDLGRNGMVLYEMKRSNNITTSNRGPQLFTVDAQSGRITVMEPPSGPGKHTLFVEASDQPANPSERRFSLAVVAIHVVETGQ